VVRPHRRVVDAVARRVQRVQRVLPVPQALEVAVAAADLPQALRARHSY